MTTATALNVVSLDDMKAHLRYPSGSNADDAGITGMIEAAVDVLSYHCDDIVPTLYDEQYDGNGCSLWLYHKPVVEILSVQDNAGYITYDLALQDLSAPVIGSSGSEGGAATKSIYAFSLDDAENGMITKRTIGNTPVPFYPGIRNVNVVYKAGRTAPYPPALVLAVKELVAHWWQNSQQRGVSLSGANLQYDAVNGEFGMARHDGSYMAIAGVPNRIFELISAHMRGPIFA